RAARPPPARHRRRPRRGDGRRRRSLRRGPALRGSRAPRAALGGERGRRARGAAGTDPGGGRFSASGQRQSRRRPLAARRGRRAAARPAPARPRPRCLCPRDDRHGGRRRRRCARGPAAVSALVCPAIDYATEEPLMDLGLTDKVALVTGASKGIGKAVALTLAAEGARVAVVARDAGALDKVVAECRDRSRKDAVAVAADLSGLEATERVVREVKERCGRIDILVNNAGAIRGGEFLKIPDAQWMGDWNLKLLGYIRMARAVLPIMQAQGGGRICNVVGAAGRNPAPNYLTGGAANAALINFTKGLADLGAPAQILVTAVSPAATATERWDSLIAAQAASSG